MSQFDFGTIDANTKSGTVLAADLNSFRTALNSCHAGSSRPSYAIAKTIWTNDATTPWVVYMFDGTDDIQIGTINATTNVFTPNMPNTPAGTIAATTIQGAINELDTEKAVAGANNDITSLSGLTTPLSKAQGGTGTATARTLNQIVTSSVGTGSTGTTPLPFDNTIPQITEGDQYMSLAITPSNVNSTLEIDVTIFLGTAVVGSVLTAALFQDATANALTAGVNFPNSASTTLCQITFKYIMTAGTTSATTFRVRGGQHSAGTTTFNGTAGSQYMGGVMSSSITIKEYLP